MVSLERSSSDLSESNLFQFNLFFIPKNQFLGEKLKILDFFFAVYLIFTKFSNFVNSDDCIRKNHPKIYQTTPVFIKKINLKSIKIRFFLVKKLEILAIVFMTAHSFYGEDFSIRCDLFVQSNQFVLKLLSIMLLLWPFSLKRYQQKNFLVYALRVAYNICPRYQRTDCAIFMLSRMIAIKIEVFIRMSGFPKYVTIS